MGEAGKRHYGWDHQHNEKYHWCGPGGVGGGGNQVRQLNIKNLVKNISYPRILKGPLFFVKICPIFMLHAKKMIKFDHHYVKPLICRKYQGSRGDLG